MTGTSDALAFLIRRSLANRLKKQLSRVKSPRYAIALLMGGAYLWLVFLNPGSKNTATVPGAASTIGTVGGIGLAITAILWWLRGGVTTALAFQPAEVQMLFPAPLTRRALIAYKLVRAQLLLLLNAVLWVFLMRRWGVALSIPMRFVTAWGFFSVLSMHRLGAALVLMPPVTGTRLVLRAAFRTLAAAAAVALLAGIVPVLSGFGTLGASAGFRSLGQALGTAPASWALAPFRLVMAPLYAETAGEWATAFAIVAAIVALHLAWIFSMDVPFEEAAATASAEMAKRIAVFKERRAGGAMVAAKQKAGGLRTRLPLKPVGLPATAIAWKNTVALIRTGSLRMAILLIAIILVSSRVIAANTHATAGAATAIPYLLITGMTFILGPRIVRNDLRQDLLNLAQLKTYPLRGFAIVASEMASPVAVLSLFQGAMVLAGYLSIPPDARASLGAPLAGSLIACPLAILALNCANVGIQNGLALLFPSWVRLGPDSGGIEAIGQNLLVMIGSMVALAICLVVPLLAAGILHTVLESSGTAAIAAAIVAGSLVLGAEVIGMVALLGKVFERIDPTSLS